MKPSNRIRKRANREQRRAEYKAACVAFLLAGGHKDWITPFHMNWRYQLAHQTQSVENGDRYFTNPRSYRDEYSSYVSPRGHNKSYIYNQATYTK